jgi:hypothetical protein
MVDPRQPQTMELGVHTGVMPPANQESVNFWVSYFNSPISNTGMPF